MTGLQRHYKSGACLEYLAHFGIQDDPRVGHRTRYTSRDMRTLRRMAREDSAHAAEIRKELRERELQVQMEKLKQTTASVSRKGLLDFAKGAWNSLRTKLRKII